MFKALATLMTARCVREEMSLGKFVNCESLIAVDYLTRVMRAPDRPRRYEE